MAHTTKKNEKIEQLEGDQGSLFLDGDYIRDLNVVSSLGIL